ncbi:MAG: hypothetical protein MZU91_11545 [Desulfosudis oleivorans]|nr:hypothetical protein [Desulfosudis oleivorans]
MERPETSGREPARAAARGRRLAHGLLPLRAPRVLRDKGRAPSGLGAQHARRLRFAHPRMLLLRPLLG